MSEQIHEGNQLRIIKENQKNIQLNKLNSIKGLSEDRIHQECYLWFHNTYPKYRGLLNYNLNNSANARAGKKNKEMGLQAGRSDFEFLWNKEVYFIEIKTETGYQSKVQKEWQVLAESQGFWYGIARNKETFIKIVNHIINLPQLYPRFKSNYHGPSKESGY